MASLKEVKTRINSVKSTRKITSAMKMVASAKLHKAQGAIENMLPYQRKLNKILTNFLSADLPIESPYIKAREVKRVAIVAFSSNTSLCGAFNANVIKMLLQTVGEFRTLGQDNILIFPVGRRWMKQRNVWDSNHRKLLRRFLTNLRIRRLPSWHIAS